MLLFFVPESPRWLVKQGWSDEATQILSRVNGTKQARQEIAAIKEVVGMESGSLLQLFEPGMRVALLIGITLAVLQQVTGINVFLYYAPEIFKTISGAETSAAMLQTIVVGAVNMGFTVIAIWSVDKLGRKPLMVLGYFGMALSLAALGLAAYSRSNRRVGTALHALLHRLFCPVRWSGHVGHPVRDLPHQDPRSGNGDRDGLPVGGQFRRLANISDAGRKRVACETFSPRGPVLALRLPEHPGSRSSCCLVPETKGRTLEEIERRWLTAKP